MQFEQTQQPWPRKELNGADVESSFNQQIANQNPSEHVASIPANKEGKRYSMKQAFSVWFDHQDSEFSQTPVPVKVGENYKVNQPQPLYHFEFSHSSVYEDSELGKGETDASFATESDTPATSEKDRPGQPPNLTKSLSFAPEVSKEGMKSVLLQPENINWVYLDPAGNEQGPFTGDIMQEWLSDGYLSLDLRIRRQEETRFKTLKEFCEAVQNFIQPFKVPLPRVVSDPPQVPMPGSFQLQVADPPVPAEGLHHGGSNGFDKPAFHNNNPSMNGPHQQLAFGSNLYSQLLPNGGLGAANIRTSSANGLFDFMGSSEYPLMNSQFSPAGNQFGLDPMNSNLSFNQLHMPSLLQQQILSQQPPLSRSNSGWGMDNSLQSAMPSTPSAAAPGPLGLSQAPLSQGSLGQPGSMSPWLNRVQNMSRVSSPFVTTTPLASEHQEKAEDNLLHDIHNSMVSGILRDEDHPRGLPSEFGADFASGNTQKQREKGPENAPKSEEQTQSEEANTKPHETSDASAQSEQPNHSTVSSRDATPKTPSEPFHESTTAQESQTSNKSEDGSHSSQAQPVVAPWAVTKEAKQDAPPLTLKQIQQMEAERLKKEKQLKAEMKQEIALANAVAASKLEEKIPEKVSFNWATLAQPTTTKKTLAEIQREEEAEAARLRASKSTSASAAKPSLASSLASVAPRIEDNGGAWTTVMSTKKPSSKKQPSTPASSGISYSSISGAINPQALRSVSATTVSTTSVNSQAVKEEFLVWARSAMTNLYPSVSKDDLLEVFTTLPLHGESSQLISETIYSSSATMDGRRFAQEFMKRRQQVENQVGPSSPESWSSAIISSADKVPTVDDEGWSTSVKSKKKGRKN